MAPADSDSSDVPVTVLEDTALSVGGRLGAAGQSSVLTVQSRHCLAAPRNVTVGVVYQHDLSCEDTVVVVEDDTSCGCECREPGLSCPGMATFHKETCSCRCNSTSLCPPDMMFSPPSCSCVCSSPASCWWPLVWEDQHCGCTLLLTMSGILLDFII